MNVVMILLGILFIVSVYVNKSVMFIVFLYIFVVSFVLINIVIVENFVSFRCLVYLV